MSDIARIRPLKARIAAVDMRRITTRSTMALRPSRQTNLGLLLEVVTNPDPLSVGIRAALAASLAILVALACGESGTAPVADSPLHLAATRDDPAIVALLISAGARPDVMAKGLTPLCLAAWDGRSAPVVRALLEGGSQVDEVCAAEQGSGRFIGPWTPLCVAVAWNTVEVVQALLDAGASVGFVCTHPCDPGGFAFAPLTSPLFFAELSLTYPEHYRSDTEASQIIVDLLIAAGAKHGGGCG